MTELNKKKLKKVSDTLQSAINVGKEFVSMDAIGKDKPTTVTDHVNFIRHILAHFPTHIQIRILARAAMQVADEQHKKIGKLARGK